jgi:GT2 family glycosyltransferase
MAAAPFVSIIIVNYNGKHLLGECLSSIFDISYPKKYFEVIVVDNNSSDDSVPYIRSHFPRVLLLESKENLGFTGGNQLAYSYATGEYIVLLNSDTKVDPHWLTGLVSAARDKKVGMINSKLYFATPFLKLRLHTSVKMRSEVYGGTDFSPLGILLEDIICTDPKLTPLVWYESGMYEKGKGEIECRWTKDEAVILVPFDPTRDKNNYTMTVHGYPSISKLSAEFDFSIGEQTLLHETIQAKDVKQYTLTVDRQLADKNKIWLVQNAGNVVLTNGYGKDRGSLLHKAENKMEEFYEHDSESYTKPAQILACCGASCLIKREVIDAIGFFDQSYFMYYEDLDLSLRAWRAGYDLVYEPSSVVYHKHRSTVKNDSNFSFQYHVEKNHLAFVAVHFPLFTVFTQFVGLTIRFCMATVFMCIYLFSENLTAYEGWRQNYEARKKALIFFVRNFPSILEKRDRIQQTSVRSFEEMRAFLY